MRWPSSVRIAHIGPAADTRSRAFPVEVEVPNPDGALLPGMIARVTASRALIDDAVVIPQDWVVTLRDERGVSTVGLSGGVFQNRVLTDQVIELLRDADSIRAGRLRAGRRPRSPETGSGPAPGSGAVSASGRCGSAAAERRRRFCRYPWGHDRAGRGLPTGKVWPAPESAKAFRIQPARAQSAGFRSASDRES